MNTRIVHEIERRVGAGEHARRVLVHPEWASAWPWLVQGTTTRDADFALSGGAAVSEWALLRTATGCPAAVHARQPHGAVVGVRSAFGPGLHLAPDADGHVTRSPRVLLGVTTADCVPVTIVAPDEPRESRAVAMVHAGWRGAAAGILERAVARMGEAWGIPPSRLHIHLGPSICGACYEVGPEVHESLGLEAPSVPTPVDLPRVLAARATEIGVSADHVTRSSWCTLCDRGGDGRAARAGDLLWSHRGGDAGRQVGFVGMRT